MRNTHGELIWHIAVRVLFVVIVAGLVSAWIHGCSFLTALGTWYSYWAGRAASFASSTLFANKTSLQPCFCGCAYCCPIVGITCVGLVISKKFRRHLDWRAFQQERREVGLCPVCGYDCRASLDQCPECGTKML